MADMRNILRGLLLTLIVTFILVSNAAASLTMPFADFQGQLWVDIQTGNYQNTVVVDSWVDRAGNPGSEFDPIISQAIDGVVLSGFSFDPITLELGITPNAELSFRIGSGADPYLTATAKDFEIVNQSSSNEQYSYLINAYLYDQKYLHTADSQFMAEYLAASSTTNPQGQLMTWEYLVDLTQQSGDYDYIINVSGKVSPVAPVPLPAAVWFFGSGLTGLGWLKRQRIS